MNVLNEEVRVLKAEIAILRKNISKEEDPLRKIDLLNKLFQLQSELNERLKNLN